MVCVEVIAISYEFNSCTRHMEQFWGASKAFFSEKWAYVYQLSGENDFIMYVVGKSIID